VTTSERARARTNLDATKARRRGEEEKRRRGEEEKRRRRRD